MKKKKDAITIVNDMILEALKVGNVLWRKPWKGYDFLPKNLISDRAYSGMNLFLLQLTPFDSSYYLTYNQIVQKGGSKKKGEKGLPITFYKVAQVDLPTKSGHFS